MTAEVGQKKKIIEKMLDLLEVVPLRQISAVGNIAGNIKHAVGGEMFHGTALSSDLKLTISGNGLGNV